jgi:hypothetical protein
MPQASIFALARSCDLDPDGNYFVTRIRPLNGNRTPLPVIAIDAIERRIDGGGGGVPRCHEITGAPTRRVVVSGVTDCPGGSAVGVKTMVDVVVTGIHVF